MGLILELSKPNKGEWFTGSISEWLRSHPSLRNKIQELPGSDNKIIAVRAKEITIGRNDDKDIVMLPQQLFNEVSRNHASIYNKGGKWWIADNGSSYGTRIFKHNPKAATMADAALTSTRAAVAVIEVKKPEELQDKDQIVLGMPGTQSGNAIILIRIQQ